MLPLELAYRQSQNSICHKQRAIYVNIHPLFWSPLFCYCSVMPSTILSISHPALICSRLSRILRKLYLWINIWLVNNLHIKSIQHFAICFLTCNLHTNKIPLRKQMYGNINSRIKKVKSFWSYSHLFFMAWIKICWQKEIKWFLASIIFFASTELFRIIKVYNIFKFKIFSYPY